MIFQRFVKTRRWLMNTAKISDGVGDIYRLDEE